MEDVLKRITGVVIVIGGLVLLTLHVTLTWAGPPNPTASDANGNTAGGTSALLNVSGFNNTAFGLDALLSNTTASNNTASGANALESNTTGGENTASGRYALRSNSKGSANTATGVNALASNTTGNVNTAIGLAALLSNTTGSGNTANGLHALFSNTTASNNTAIGVEALLSNTTGTGNTATGAFALESNIVGRKNTAVGNSALSQSTGTKNIGIGFRAGVTLTTGNNNIYIGNQGNGDESQTIRIGTAQTQTFIPSIALATIVANGATVEIDTTTGQLGIGLISSVRYKRDIAAMGTRSEKVLQLRPVTFAYKDDAQGMTHYGLIAEEVAAVYPELVTHTATGEVQAVRYQELIPMLVNELQRQQHVTEHLRQELVELRSLVGQMREGVALR